ncbi:MAG: peptide chain release factor N(5)-glutamine methyltransferase [Candidatus Nomurabacteria bacterium]|jgi:release factor glutamine methyltransferase|nr:peptide chain release factor N(5)-glutamine methyltransferase [Candidatus Nomurabacteria bacterium]
MRRANSIITVADWLTEAEKVLAQAKVLSPHLDAGLLLTTAMSISEKQPLDRSQVYARASVPLDADTLDMADKFLERRKNREPLAYIAEKKEFYGREFTITSSVLVPRPETETIIDIVKALPLKSPKIVDVGTGSGVIGITLALELPNAKLTLSDLSSAACTIASYNMRMLGVGAKIVQSNLMKDVFGTYDLVVANLPYVDRDWEVSPETAFEPERALFASDEGMFYIKKLLQEAKTKLTKSGLVIIEADTRQHAKLIDFADKNDYKHRLTKGLILVFSLTKDIHENSVPVVKRKRK